MCDVNVWVVTATGLEIKWCKGCKNFRPWAAFGDKGLATKCVRCRERQREKYALQKEEKERARSDRSVGNNTTASGGSSTGSSAGSKKQQQPDAAANPEKQEETPPQQVVAVTTCDVTESSVVAE